MASGLFSGLSRRKASAYAWRAVVAASGVGGLVGLLTASSYAPDAAEELRIAALVWYAAFGAVWVALPWLPRKARSEASKERQPGC